MDWIDVPGGEVLLGLTPDEVERLVRLNIQHNERFLEDDVDRGRFHDDREWYKALGGNAGTLRLLLTRVCPLRKVVLRPFRLASRPVSLKEYEEFCRSTGRAFKEPFQSRPEHFMSGMTWEEARACAAWADARLPSSAEWEWAARGPSRRLFPWGQDWSSGADGFMYSGNWVRPWVPGSRPGLASPEGLLDMATDHGEWCSDPYSAAPEDWALLAHRKKEEYRPGWGVLMGSSPNRLLPNGALPFGGPPGTYRMSDPNVRLARDA